MSPHSDGSALRPQSDYPDGVDASWLAVDGAQHLALFITAGEGGIPAAVLDTSLPGTDAIAQALMELAVITSAGILLSVPRDDDYRAMAVPGLYVYDWTGSAYALAGRPGMALVREDLPPALAAIAALARFPQLSFAQCSTLQLGGGRIETADPALPEA